MLLGCFVSILSPGRHRLRCGAGWPGPSRRCLERPELLQETSRLAFQLMLGFRVSQFRVPGGAMKKLLAAIIFFSFAIAVLAQSPTSPSTEPQKPAVSAQEPASGIDGDRREAMDLFEEGKTTQALALF